MIQQRPVAALCLLSLVPATAIVAIAWFWAPTWSAGRSIVTLSYALFCLVALRVGLPRRRQLKIARGSTLSWEPGIECDDPYTVALHQDGRRELLLEGDDPAPVLADARRIASETGAILLGPEWLNPRHSASPQGGELAVSSEEGLLWPTQLRTARTALCGGLFVLLVFVGSIHAESEISLLGAGLPLLTVALALAIAASLGKMRIWIHSGPQGLRAERRGFGAPRALFAIPLESLRGVRAVGHPSYPERHLLLETTSGPVSIPCAEATARRVARLWTRTAGVG